VGGVLGAPPPPQPPKPTGPKIVSASVGRGQLLIDPNAERYRVKLRLVLARSGDTYTALRTHYGAVRRAMQSLHEVNIQDIVLGTEELSKVH
jgi:hypothetical protein